MSVSASDSGSSSSYSSDFSGSGSGSEGGEGGATHDDAEVHQDEEQQVVTGANADPAVLQHFWDLASLQEDTRQETAAALVAALVDSQAAYDASQRPAGSQPGGSLLAQEGGGTRQQRLETSLTCCSPLMAYGLKRLARGLASSRQGARQGFAAALAATLAHSAAAAAAAGVSAGAHGKKKQQQQQQQAQLQQPCVSAAGVLALLDACLEVTGSMKGSEQRDALLGRVFGLAALSRSGLLTACPAAGAAQDSSLATTAVVAEQLAGLLRRKSFLRESAAASLAELLQDLDQQQMAAVVAQAPKTAALLAPTPGKATPESMLLALRLWHALPPELLRQCSLLPALPKGAAPPPALFWQQPLAVKRKAVAAAAAAVFSSAHVARMADALLLSTASHPRLHPVWGCLLALLLPGFVPVKGGGSAQQQQDKQQQQQRAAPDTQQLQALWQGFVVDRCLGSSHERKALALQLLLLVVPVLAAETVPLVLSKQMLGCIATALKDKGSYLHARAERCVDRLSTAAEHSQVLHDDAAAAARLRLALSAALQSASLVAPSSKSAKAARAGPLQGLDAGGVAEYVDQTLQALVAAAQGRQRPAAANGAANGAHGSSSDDDDEEDAASDAKALQQLEQLVAGLRLPAADAATLHKGLAFLAALAFMRLPAGFDAAALALGSSSTDGAQQPKKKAGGKKAKGAKAAAASSAEEPGSALADALRLAASIQPQPSPALRQTAGARLVGLLHSLQHKPVPQEVLTAAAAQARTAHKQQQQQQDVSAAGAGQQLSKKQRAAQHAAQEAAAGAARAAAAKAAEAVAVQLLELVMAVQQAPGAALVVDEDIFEMVEQLGQLGVVVARSAPQLPAGASTGGSDAAATAQLLATRQRAVLHLVHQLQLQLLSGGLSAEAAGSVVDDLEVSVLRGLGLSEAELEALRAADAAAKLKLSSAAAAAAASGSDDDASSLQGSEADEAQSGSSDGSDEEEGAPAWQDVLLDLLLSLLSNSGGGEQGAASRGSSGSGGASVPSVPLREACEAVFRAFAEEMTAQGIADLLRVLSQRASELLKSTGDDDEDEEEEEEQDASGSEVGDGSGSGDDDDDDGSGSSSDGMDEEQQQLLQDLHRKTQGDAAADSDSKEDDADADGSASDLDDEAMLRLDAQLGAAVRASLDRGSGSAKDRAAALLALQLRVASLLEDWLKRCPRSPLVLGAVQPLVKALVTASGGAGSPVLAERLVALINKQLSRAHPVLPAGEAQQQAATAVLQEDCKRVLYHASRDRDARVSGAAGQALLVLLAAGAASGGGGGAAAAVQGCAAAALRDFFEHKKSRLPLSWCQALLARAPDAVFGGSGEALTVLLTAAAKGRNEAQRSKAAALLPGLLAGRSADAVAALLPVLAGQQALLAAALGGAVTGPFRGKEAHATAVKGATQLVAAATKAGGGKRLAELLGSEAVRELGKCVVVVQAAGVPPKVAAQLDNLVKTAGLQQLVAAGKPDPARLALLNKARAALQGGAAAANGAPAAQQGVQQAAAGSKKRRAEADAGGNDAAAAGDGAAKQQAKKKQGTVGAGKKAAAGAGKRKRPGVDSSSTPSKKQQQSKAGKATR